MTDAFDFEDFQPDKDDLTLDGLLSKAKELDELNKEIAQLEEEVKQFNKRKKRLEEVEIPYILRDLGVGRFDFEDGTRLTTEAFCHGTFKNATEEGKEFVLNNGGAELLKTEVSVFFDKKAHNEALSFVADLRDQGLDPDVSEAIHPQTYAAYGRELLKDYEQKLEKGQDARYPPFRDLGLYAGRKAKVTRGK